MANEVGKIEYTITVNKDGLVTGIKQANNSIDELGKEAENSSSKVGNLAVAVGKIGVASAIAGITAVTTGVIGLGKASVDAYANYEQLTGGVETIFGENNLKVLDNAKQAYKTAGVSMNEYMETVTGFSASLIQSLSGDTAKAVDYADRALRDMSDNANKYGSDIKSIQIAYQGFAKQNYTMLDNLKLGYGGTQKEMERLIRDASQLKDVQAELGVTIDENSLSFGNIVDAISVMQTAMGIAGTTAKEAETTISGSIGTMNKAWDNLVLSMTTGEGVEEAFQAWSDAFLQVITNLDPIINTLAENLPIVAEKLGEFLPKIIEPLTPVIQTIVKSIAEICASMTEQLVPIILPAVLKLAYEVGKTLVVTIVSWLWDLYNQFANIFSELGVKFREWINDIALKLTEFLYVSAGKFGEWALGVYGKIRLMWEKIKEVFSSIGVSISEAITGAVKGAVNSVLGFAENTVNGFIRAINTALGVINAIPGVSISTLSELSIPRLATGGIVEAGNGGSIIRAGEAGEDEWVVPESKMASLVEQINEANRGNNITINVSGTFATSETEQRRVAEQIYDALQDINRSRMGAYL